MPDITYDVGRVSFVMKGAWNLATAYEKLDAVSYNGSLYIAKQDVPGGTAITNTTYWQLAAEKGDQGETGNGIASITLTGTAGNVDTYTITFTDGTTTTFTVTNGGVTTVNGRTGDVTGLAEEDGSYPLLNAGTADNLTPYSEDSGATQDIPFIAQGTGCGNGESVVDTGSYLQLKKKLGNTVCVNQLAKFEAANIPSARNSLTFSYTDGKSYKINGTADATGSASGWFNLSEADGLAGKAGHKLLCIPRLISGAITGNANHGLVGVAGHPFLSAFIDTAVEAGGQIRYSIGWESGTVFNDAIVTFEFHDIDLWFGSNDRIPSDLLSHPENWGRYYSGSLAYDAGHLENADGSVLTSIGRNVFDKDTVKTSAGNYILNDSGSQVADSTSSYFTEKTPVIPNTTYYRLGGNTLGGLQRIYFFDQSGNFISRTATISNNGATFTTPSNCFFIGYQYIKASVDTSLWCISLYYPGESGYDQYYPFSVLAEVDTGSEVLRSAGAVADEKTPDGTITRRVGVVDLGTLTWYYNISSLGAFTSTTLASLVAGGNRIICSKYSLLGVALSTSSIQSNDKFVRINKSGNSAETGNFAVGTLVIKDTSYTDAATFKTAMSGVYLVYELATPTTEQGTAFAENIPCDDFGSMYWTQTKGIPQGNEIFYPVDYKASIDTLYNRVDGDMSKIVTEDEYPEAPSLDGTYVLKATVSGGTKTYAWVAE